jgi:alkylation response protein AidB-like acyl-CoA dehydrogenase
MNFGLSPEQEQLQHTARDFLAKEWPPSSAHALFDAESEAALRQLYRRMAELGWVGLLAPPEFGGSGGTFLDAALLAEEMGRAAVPGPYLANTLALLLLRDAGSKALRSEWLPALTQGQAIGTVAWFEAQASSWPCALETRCTATRLGVRLSGTKRFVLDAHLADVFLVVCTAPAGRAKTTVVVLVPNNQPGITVRPMDDVDRTRRVYEVSFEDVAVPRKAVFVSGERAVNALARVFDAAAVFLAADSLGGAQRLLEMSVAYAKVRTQFGRPIGSFQAVKHRCAEMVAQIEPARSLMWYAAHTLDAMPRLATYAASLAKGHLAEVYAAVAESALRVHGGIGFTWEHDLHIWFKRAQWNRYAFGTPEWHRERVAQMCRW